MPSALRPCDPSQKAFREHSENSQRALKEHLQSVPFYHTYQTYSWCEICSYLADPFHQLHNLIPDVKDWGVMMFYDCDSGVGCDSWYGAEYNVQSLLLLSLTSVSAQSSIPASAQICLGAIALPARF